ncbi:hemolysin family protein [Spirosoma sp. 209]|uniref:hemolysin family protein n=1 Tax=Spirosoma sp. 209 TaxID=1955701 RepID=UPI00098CF215|nr:hemolysin family protein [Spirosoma sp. 209]
MEIVIIIALTLLNGLFSMSEIAIVSARKARLEGLAKRGSATARRALDLAESPNRFLSTVQIGITLIGILLGIFSGDTLTTSLEMTLRQIPLLTSVARPLAVGGVLLFITFLSLVLGELVPKRIGLNKPEAIAQLVAGPMSILSRVVSPFVWLLTITTEGLLKVLGIRPSTDSAVTEEEIKAIIQEGTEGGEVQLVEQELVDRVFRLGDRNVRSLMTHRSEVTWLDVNLSASQVRKRIAGELHRIYPVCEGSLDKPLGVVRLTDVVEDLLNGQSFDLRSHIQPALFLPEHNAAYKAFERFQAAAIPFGLVTDEYGGVQGVLSLDDIVTALVGEVTFMSEAGGDVQPQPDGSYLIDGQYPYPDFLDYFDREELLDQDDRFHTVAGLILDRLGHLPQPGESIRWHEFTLTVDQMDGARIDRVRVHRRLE